MHCEESSPYLSDRDAKEAILEVGRRMYAKNYVVSNDGNITCKVSPTALWTTPTGVSKGYMTDEMLIKVDLEGHVLQGTRRPSSELKMHLRVYQENPDLIACVHAHPPAATAFAIAGIALDRPILPEGVVQLGVVPVAPYATPGTQEVPDSIAPYCRTHNGVLLANHGALTWGSSPMQAYMRMESLEYYALITMYTDSIIGRANELSREQVDRLVEIRTGLGITAGGRPACRDEHHEERSERPMLRGIPNCITPELLKVLHEMGHGDTLVIGDANFPAASIAAAEGHVNIRCDGHRATELLDAILQLMPLDNFVDKPVTIMNRTERHKDLECPIWDEFEAIVARHDPRGAGAVDFLDRFPFYAAARKAYAVVSTTETVPYACIILQKGCL